MVLHLEERGYRLGFRDRRLAHSHLEAPTPAVCERSGSLWLYEQGYHFRMSRAHLTFDVSYQPFDVRRAQSIRELQAQGHDDMLGTELEGDDSIDVSDARLASRYLRDGCGDRRVRLLSDQQTFALSGNYGCGRGKHEPDQQ